MLGKRYAKWMYAWETALTTRDENRVVRPLEWGFDWLNDFVLSSGLAPRIAASCGHPQAEEDAFLALNEAIIRTPSFFDYDPPSDYRLETRHPELFPTNVRPETLAQDAKLKEQAANGELAPAEFLRFTSPLRTPYPENDLVNARWFPAPPERQAGKPKQAIIVMPQWNADAFSHNALCTLFNRFGISALRLSKPYHDIRRPAELERSDYAVSANIGRTIAACRQAVVDIRCCLDWLQAQGYEQFGILGTSLGSCYAFVASAFDARLQVNAFNHASMSFGDVVWTGQSTRHIRAALENEGLTQARLDGLWRAISPVSYIDRFAATPKKVLVVHATYDLTFLREFSQEVLRSFAAAGIRFQSKVLPCGHYTTGEFPFNYLDGWYLGKFVYSAFKDLAQNPGPPQTPIVERELVAQ
ncbi:MAG: alpha/beta hydrolase family protein [Acidobacteriaceae bacterium]